MKKKKERTIEHSLHREVSYKMIIIDIDENLKAYIVIEKHPFFFIRTRWTRRHILIFKHVPGQRWIEWKLFSQDQRKKFGFCNCPGHVCIRKWRHFPCRKMKKKSVLSSGPEIPDFSQTSSTSSRSRMDCSRVDSPPWASYFGSLCWEPVQQ